MCCHPAEPGGASTRLVRAAAHQPAPSALCSRIRQFLNRELVPHRVHNGIHAFKFWIAVFRKNFLAPLAAKAGGFSNAAHAFDLADDTQG